MDSQLQHNIRNCVTITAKLKDRFSATELDHRIGICWQEDSIANGQSAQVSPAIATKTVILWIVSAAP